MDIRLLVFQSRALLLSINEYACQTNPRVQVRTGTLLEGSCLTNWRRSEKLGRPRGEMQSEFQKVLQRLITQSGKSTTAIANLSGCDRAYILRLINGEKVNPSPETVARIWLGVCMDAEVVKNYPTFVHGLVELMLAVGMTRLAASKRSE